MTEYFIHYITQEKAKDIGIGLYFEGRMCAHGNYYLRRLSDRRCRCDDCREAKAAKERIRKENTPDKKSERNEYSRQYRKNNKAKIRQLQKDYLLVQKQQNTESYRKHLEKLKMYNRRAKLKNPFMAKASAATARVKKKYPDAITPSYGELDIFVTQQAYELKHMRQHSTKTEWAVDHMMPLARGGKHEWSNLQVIPFKLNLLKKHKLAITNPYEWLIYCF